jgi:hypothetical protein
MTKEVGDLTYALIELAPGAPLAGVEVVQGGRFRLGHGEIGHPIAGRILHAANLSSLPARYATADLSFAD